MPRLTDVQRTALANWWTLAETAAYRGFTTTDTIAAASDLAQQAGAKLAFAESAAIATLFGYGSRMSAAGEQLRGSAMDAVIGPEMIGTPPWARDEQVMLTTPIWHVTYRFSYIDQAGNPQIDFRTSVFEMTFPETIGELQDAISADAQQLADKYGVRLVDAQLHEILAV